MCSSTLNPNATDFVSQGNKCTQDRIPNSKLNPNSLPIKPNEVGNKLHCALNPVSVNNNNVDTFINVFNGTMENSKCNSADCNITDPNLKVKLNPLAKKSVQNKSMDLRISVNEIKPFTVSL